MKVVREWIDLGKYCTLEEISKSKKKAKVRDPCSKYPQLDEHIRSFIKEKERTR